MTASENVRTRCRKKTDHDKIKYIQSYPDIFRIFEEENN